MITLIHTLTLNPYYSKLSIIKVDSMNSGTISNILLLVYVRVKISVVMANDSEGFLTRP